MTNSEFSNEFDILYNNIMSNQAPGLNEYEKSIFLTKAQDELIKNYFNPKGNKYQEGFDDSQKRQIDFSMLMKTISPDTVTPVNPIHLGDNIQYYAMPNDILLYINEFLDVNRKGTIQRLMTVPLAYEEYSRLMSKPYKRPLKNQAWRLITSGEGVGYTYTDYAEIAHILHIRLMPNIPYDKIYSVIYNKNITTESGADEAEYLKVDGSYFSKSAILENNITDNTLVITGYKSQIIVYLNSTIDVTTTVVQLIPGPNDTISNYLVRYVRKPRPIILEDLEGVTINGEDKESYCELDSSLHQEILQRAVELAKAAYTGDINSIIETGKRSE